MVRLGCPGSIQPSIRRGDYSCALGGFDFRELDHLRPFLGFLGNQPCEVVARTRQDRAAQLDEPSLEGGIGESRIDLHIEKLDDFIWRIPWVHLRQTPCSPQSPATPGGASFGAGMLNGLGSLVAALVGAPGRATGGPVSGGRGYLVGEHGPELFVPSSGGRIEHVGGSRRDVRVAIAIQTPAPSDPQVLRQSSRQVARAIRTCARERAMNLWFTRPDAKIVRTFVKRFDPLHWTIDFPRGAIASVVTTPDAHGLSIACEFLREGDLVGLIWESEDRHAHPAHARETSRDYSDCTLSFHWESSGVIALDAVNGPTLTIEGTDASGNPQIWLVRLWNYAVGHARERGRHARFQRARRRVRPAGGCGTGSIRRAIDRMFISLVAPGYVGGIGSAVRGAGRGERDAQQHPLRRGGQRARDQRRGGAGA